MYYYQQVAQTLMPVGTSVQTLQGQIIQQSGGGTYLIQSSTIDSDGTPLTHTTRASPVTVSCNKFFIKIKFFTFLIVRIL
jgi:hypothetical protein